MFEYLGSLLSTLAVISNQPGMFCASAVCIEAQIDGGAVSFYAFNYDEFLTATLTLEIEFENMEFTEDSSGQFVLPPETFGSYLFTLSPVDSERSTHWEYSFYWNGGDATAEHDNDHLYLLPFRPGKSYTVSQSCFGEYSHFDHSRFALDFGVPVGTEILAARDGSVVSIKENSDVGAPSEVFARFGNYVMIEHSDGTHALYYHLQLDGAAVSLGDQVQAGQLIGFSGNTGFSSGPHLHFSVNGGTQSVPFKLHTLNGIFTCPTAGVALSSSPIGKDKSNSIIESHSTR